MCAGPNLADWLCLGVGYATLACLALLAAWLVLSWRLLLQRWQPHLARHSFTQAMQRLMHGLGPRLLVSAGLLQHLM